MLSLLLVAPHASIHLGDLLVYSAVIICNKKPRQYNECIRFDLVLSQLGLAWVEERGAWHRYKRGAGLVWCPCSCCSCSSNSKAPVRHKLEQGLMLPVHPHNVPETGMGSVKAILGYPF